MTYQAINLGGAIALAVNSAYHGAWPSAILNIVWTAIGVLTVGRFVATKGSPSTHDPHRPQPPRSPRA